MKKKVLRLAEVEVRDEINRYLIGCDMLDDLDHNC